MADPGGQRARAPSSSLGLAEVDRFDKGTEPYRLAHLHLGHSLNGSGAPVPPNPGSATVLIMPNSWYRGLSQNSLRIDFRLHRIKIYVLCLIIIVDITHQHWILLN